jgi:hypothetical protein
MGPKHTAPDGERQPCKGAEVRRIKSTLIALIAISALSAIASATASAATEPQFLPGEGTKFTSTSGPGTLETAKKGNIECAADTDEGTLTSDTTGVVTIDFTKCKALGIIGAHSLGDAGETILVSGTELLCWINEAKDEAGAYVHLPSAGIHIEISAVAKLLLVKGSVLGKVEPAPKNGEKHKSGKLILKQTKGAQEFTKCEGGKEEILETSENGGAFEKSGEQTTDEIFWLKTEVELMIS